jgi:predicted lipid-binding transport protein (Tim44 family)
VPGASQQLADSIAKAKADMAKQQQSSTASTTGSSGQQRELTPEEKAQAQQACEALKNFDIGKAMANAGKSVVGEALQEVKQEQEAEAKNKAKDKIKGLFKKPHL